MCLPTNYHCKITIMATKLTKQLRLPENQKMIVTFKPALLEYPRYTDHTDKPKVIPTPLAYHRPTAAYLAFAFPSAPPKLANNHVSIYNLPHGYFYRVF